MNFRRMRFPPLWLTFVSFHNMVVLGMYFILLMAVAAFSLYRGTLWDSPRLLKLMLWSMPLPLIACQLGWIAAEVGRQPWIVYGLLRTSQAASITVSAGEILFSIILFGLVYLALGALYVYLFARKVKHGPEPVTGNTDIRICKGGGCIMDLQAIWFLLVGVLIIGYAILDGFDLGVGVLHLFLKNEQERRLSLNAIGPVWDGNEVWLLTGGGALFAAFPVVYATVFSGFYLALMLLLVALIFRAVSMEFRGKVDSPAWKKVWDWAFGIGSLLPAVLFGVAFGNILRGLPINEQGAFTGSFFGLLNPYAILIGVLSLCVFIMHGAIYLALKTEGELQERMISVASSFWVATVGLYTLATLVSFFVSPFLFEGMLKQPALLGTLPPAACFVDLRACTAEGEETLQGVPGIVDVHRGHDRPERREPLPAPGAFDHRSGLQPDDPQCLFHPRHVDRHAGHRPHRDADRDRVHDLYLPGVQGKGGTDGSKLLKRQ